jgi:hypothetical protein
VDGVAVLTDYVQDRCVVTPSIYEPSSAARDCRSHPRRQSTTRGDCSLPDVGK